MPRATKSACGPSEPASESGVAGPVSESERGWGPASNESEDMAVVDGTLRAPWKWEQLIVEASVVGGTAIAGGVVSTVWRTQYRMQIREAESKSRNRPGPAIERDIEQPGAPAAFFAAGHRHLAAWPMHATWGEWLTLWRVGAEVLRRPARVLEVLADLRPIAPVGPVSLDEVRNVLSERLPSLENRAPGATLRPRLRCQPASGAGPRLRRRLRSRPRRAIFPQKPREDPMLLDQLRGAARPGLARAGRPRPRRAASAEAGRWRRVRAFISRIRARVSPSRARACLPSMRSTSCERSPDDSRTTRACRRTRPRSRHQAGMAGARRSRVARSTMSNTTCRCCGRCSTSPVPADVEGPGPLHPAAQRFSPAIGRRGGRAGKGAGRRTTACGFDDRTRAALAGQRLGARPYSLSALQRYATCPYQFLLSAIYRLEARQEPEPLQRLDPLTRGSIFHRVQAEFFRALDLDASPPAAAPWRMRSIARQVVERVAGEHSTISRRPSNGSGTMR